VPTKTTVTAAVPVPAVNGSNASNSERRREIRYPCEDPVEIRCLHGDGSSFSATVLDISKSGLRVAVAGLLTEGARVEIVLPKQVVIFGEVRHCTCAGEMCQAGILIEEVFYSKNLESEHPQDDALSLYLAGRGLMAREVLALGQHIRTCGVCNERLEKAKLLSETVGRGRMAKR
jgi:hypothetical protein